MTRLLAAALTVCLLCGVAPARAAQPGGAKAAAGKGGGKGAAPAEVKRLDTKLDEVREAFVRETTNLILSYDRLGQFERARTVLESLQKLDPRNEAVKAKLAELDAKILAASEFEVDLKPDGGWQAIGAVTKDRQLKIQVAGDYKISIGSLETGPAGVRTGDVTRDLVPNVPLGAVMGAIVPAGALDATGGGGFGDRPPKAFTVGTAFERTADRDGVLYMKVNLPPEAKCTGRITAKVNGPERTAP
jgi:hypothetical protein